MRAGARARAGRDHKHTIHSGQEPAGGNGSAIGHPRQRNRLAKPAIGHVSEGLDTVMSLNATSDTVPAAHGGCSGHDGAEVAAWPKAMGHQQGPTHMCHHPQRGPSSAEAAKPVSQQEAPLHTCSTVGSFPAGSLPTAIGPHGRVFLGAAATSSLMLPPASALRHGGLHEGHGESCPPQAGAALQTTQPAPCTGAVADIPGDAHAHVRTYPKQKAPMPEPQPVQRRRTRAQTCDEHAPMLTRAQCAAAAAAAAAAAVTAGKAAASARQMPAARTKAATRPAAAACATRTQPMKRAASAHPEGPYKLRALARRMLRRHECHRTTAGACK
eukprot:353445-Chlamydomonas_euryale.AAC.25